MKALLKGGPHHGLIVEDCQPAQFIIMMRRPKTQVIPIDDLFRQRRELKTLLQDRYSRTDAQDADALVYEFAETKTIVPDADDY